MFSLVDLTLIDIVEHDTSLSLNIPQFQISLPNFSYIHQVLLQNWSPAMSRPLYEIP